MTVISRILILFCWICFLAAPAWAVQGKKTILFVNSYENGYRWSDSILNGIRSAIGKSRQEVDLRIEYMDSRRHYDRHVESMLANYYHHKYGTTQPDAIIVSDNTAFDFMLRYRERLFPEVPLIFCGVNNFTDETIRNEAAITGIGESVDFLENLRVARSLHPNAKRMVVIGNNSLTALAIIRQLESDIRNSQIKFPVRFLTRFKSEELMEELKTIPPDTLIFFLPFYEKRGTTFISSREIMEQISVNTPFPIYSAWDFYLGAGLVGGKLISGFDHGRTAAEMALETLKGKSAKELPVVRQVRATYIFDHNALKRFRILRADLPEGSRIINAPQKSYELDKRLVWFLVIAFLILSGTLFFLVRNINERKRVEDSLRTAEEKYRNIFKNAGKGIVIVNQKGDILEMNPAFARMFGYGSEEKFPSEKKKLQSLFVSQDRRKQLIRRIMDGREVAGFELEFYTTGGAVRWASITAKTSFSPGWNQQVIECICEDISQRKHAEITVWESREKLRHILDNIPQIVFWQDQDMRFKEVNKSFLSFFKIRRAEDIIGKKDYNLMGIGEDAQRAIETNNQVIRTNVPQYRLKWDFKTLGDEPIWLEINKIPLHDKYGKTTGILSTAEDITQKINLERQLRQSQKMEALGILSGGIAHDFNNILTSIINSTELAMEDVPAQSITRKDLMRVLTAGNRGSELVKQILTFSRPQPHAFHPMDLKETVNEALGLLRTSLPGNIQIRSEMRPGLAPCMGDAAQIHQIIMNLGTNAFQAMSETGGEFTLSLESCRIEDVRARLLDVSPGAYLKLSIQDNGPGIPADILDKIFDPFFTTKSKDVGTGLGLSVVHGIIKGHKGAIQVDSRPFDATRFRIYLPQIRDYGHAPVPLDSPAPRGTEHLLFVEDNEDQQESIPRALGSLGYTVKAVGNATDALAEFYRDTSRFDLVITDFDMPGTNGAELAREIHATEPELPVIMVSGREPDPKVMEIPNIKTFILKPYDKRTLSRAVRRVMDS